MKGFKVDFMQDGEKMRKDASVRDSNSFIFSIPGPGMTWRVKISMFNVFCTYPKQLN